MSTTEKPTAPFVLTLIAGLLIIAGGGTGMMWFSSGMPMWGGMMGGMMGGWQGMMGGMGFGGGPFFGMGLLGILLGIVLIVGAFMLYNQPNQASMWGTIILIFSILSFFGMGGFFIGAILGFVGGILALTWKPTTPA